jgi:apolipoprotein N-acyltransferase
MTETRFSNKQLIALALSTGILLGVSFPPIPTGIPAFVAFIPYLFMIDRAKSSMQVFRYSYLSFLSMNALSIYWVSGWSGSDPWLKAAGVVLVMIFPLWFTLPSVAFYLIRKRLQSPVSVFAFPFIWVAYEWLTHLPELSFPWLLVSNTQTYNLSSIQFASITGAFGISFWVTSVNVLLYFLLHQYLVGKKSLRSKSVIASVLAVLALLLLPQLYSRMVLSSVSDNHDPTVSIGLIQPNVDPYEKWNDEMTAIHKLKILMSLYDSICAGSKIELVLFPETAVPFRILLPSYEEEWRWFEKHIDSVGVPVFSGFPDLKWYSQNEPAPISARKIQGSDIRYDDFNSSFLIIPGRDQVQRYHKSRLTPLSERIPYLDAIPFLQNTLTWGVGISNWGLGNDTTTFALHYRQTQARFWAMICYETIYPEFVSGFVKRGANFLGVITNDGWFGKTSGPYQLMQYTALRAIENRRSVARCANNGISCFIDPYGRITQETQLYTRTAIQGKVEVRSELTFYTKHGDWLPRICSGVSACIFLFIIVLRLKRKKA